MQSQKSVIILIDCIYGNTDKISEQFSCDLSTDNAVVNIEVCCTV